MTLLCGIENHCPEPNNDLGVWLAQKKPPPWRLVARQNGGEGRQETLRPSATGAVAEGEADFSGERRR